MINQRTLNLNGETLTTCMLDKGFNTFHVIYKLGGARKWRTLAWGFSFVDVTAHANRRIVETLADPTCKLAICPKKDPTTDDTPAS